MANMSNKTDYFTPTPSHNGCLPDCLVPSSSKNPVCSQHCASTVMFMLGPRLSPPLTLEAQNYRRRDSRTPSLGPLESICLDLKTKLTSETPTIKPTPSYNELLRKFLLFCVAVELNVEASLEKEEFLTKKELIHFVELAQFYCGKFQSSNTKNQARERQLRVTITNTAEEMGLDVRFVYSMLPIFIELIQPPSKGEEIHARVLPPFWKSTLGQPKGEDEAWKLMTRLETYDYFVPWLTGERIENPLLNQEFKAKIQNGEGEKLEEKLDISIQERMKDAAKEVQLDVKQCIETIHRKSSRGKSDSVTGVIDGKRPGGGIPSPDPGTRLPDLTIALEIVDFMRNHDTANIGRRGEGNSSNKNTEFCSHAKMRAVWEVVSSQHDTRSDRRRTRARALTEKIKARGKRIISRLSWWKPPTLRRLWTNHLERKGGRVKRARGEVERVEAELEYGKAEEEQEVIAE